MKPLSAGQRKTVTANDKIPKTAKIEFPTFVSWSQLRHNGLVSRRVEKEATHAESGGPIHDQGHASQRYDH